MSPTKRLPANFGKPWSPEEDARIKTLFEAGANVVTIAERQDRTQSSVRLRLEKLGLIDPEAA